MYDAPHRPRAAPAADDALPDWLTEEWELARARHAVRRFFLRRPSTRAMCPVDRGHFLYPAWDRVRKVRPKVAVLPPAHATSLAVRAGELGCVDELRLLTGSRRRKWADVGHLGHDPAAPPPTPHDWEHADAALRLLGMLGGRDRRAVELRFGLDGGGARSLQEVGREMGFSMSLACVTIAAALESVRVRCRKTTRPGWKKIDPAEFTRLYRSGEKMVVIAARLGVTVAACKAARGKLSLEARATGRPPR